MGSNEGIARRLPRLRRPIRQHDYDGSYGMTSQTSIERIAAAYPPEAAQTLAKDRERYFTAEQQAAWELRFAPHRVALLRNTSVAG
jgi:hypothetical protein